jgi:hypothetical protein
LLGLAFLQAILAEIRNRHADDPLEVKAELPIQQISERVLADLVAIV